MDRKQTSETEHAAPKITIGEAIDYYGLTSHEEFQGRGLQYIMEPLGQSPYCKCMLLRSDVVDILKKRSNENARAIEAKE